MSLNARVGFCEMDIIGHRTSIRLEHVDVLFAVFIRWGSPWPGALSQL